MVEKIISHFRFRSGKCNKCENILEMQTTTAEEFERLKKAIMEIALIGDNTFLKTTPDELQKFVQFIENTAPYDIVLDGLNVAFRTHAKPTLIEKAETVSHFP